VNAQGVLVDENGNPIEIDKLESKPIQPVVNAKQSKQIIANNAQQAAIGQVENNAVWNNVIPETQGNDSIWRNNDKIQQLIQSAQPKVDEQRMERNKKIAAVNSIGQGVSAALSGIVGVKKGGQILNTNTDITPKALADYNSLLKEKQGYEYQTALAKANAGITALKEQAANDLANKRYNQQLKSDWQKLKAKITLEDIQDRNKTGYEVPGDGRKVWL